MTYPTFSSQRHNVQWIRIRENFVLCTAFKSNQLIHMERSTSNSTSWMQGTFELSVISSPLHRIALHRQGDRWSFNFDE